LIVRRSDLRGRDLVASYHEVVIVDGQSETTNYEAAHRTWETLAAIGPQAPPAVWEELPTDPSKRVDDYLHSRNKPH
jgi:hypothetical protein